MSSDGRRGFGEYVQQRTTASDQNQAKSRLQEALEEANQHLARGEFVAAGELLRDTVLPTFRQLSFTKTLPEYNAVMANEELPWHWRELWSFAQDPTRYIEAAQALPGSQTLQRHSGQSAIERTVRSMESLATHESVLQSEYETSAEVRGHATTLGRWLQDEEMNVGDPVFGFVENETGFKSLHCGRTNGGKSTGLEAEVWDFYQRNFADDGQPTKIIDLVGFRQGENWLLDVPQQQDVLRDARDDLELAPDFVAAGQEQPEIEILHPLINDFSKESLPFNTDADEFSVRPFTIPASEINPPVLISLIDARLTQSQESTFRNIYDEVNNANDDWALKDIADAIRDRDTLSDKDKDAAIGALAALQNQGFIRTKDCEFALEWDDIFHSTETITVFSQALCENKAHQLVTVAYLADEIFRRRKEMVLPPECVLVMREFWEVAPHSERQEDDAEADAILDDVGSTTAKLVRQNRHIRANVTADTQAPSDLLKSVRERFNRFVVYGIDYDTIKDIFDWTLNNRAKKFASTVGPKPGEAGIVGQVQAALEEKNIEFYSPVRMAPPPHHHFDVESDGTGWAARAKYFTPTEECPECGAVVERSEDGWYVTCLDEECGEETFDPSGGRNETLRRPMEVDGVEWPDQVPDELEIESFIAPDDREEHTDPSTAPVKAFVEQCITRNSGVNTPKHRVYDAYNSYAQEHDLREYDFDDQSDLTKFGNRFAKHVTGAVDSTKIDGARAYQDLVLTAKGEEYLDKDKITPEEAAAPIDTAR